MGNYYYTFLQFSTKCWPYIDDILDNLLLRTALYLTYIYKHKSKWFNLLFVYTLPSVSNVSEPWLALPYTVLPWFSPVNHSSWFAGSFAFVSWACLIQGRQVYERWIELTNLPRLPALVSPWTQPRNVISSQGIQVCAFSPGNFYICHSSDVHLGFK